MNKQELAWKHFEETGSILDYLQYCHLTDYAGTEGDTPYADFYRWNRSESKKPWKR